MSSLTFNYAMIAFTTSVSILSFMLSIKIKLYKSNKPVFAFIFGVFIVVLSNLYEPLSTDINWIGYHLTVISLVQIIFMGLAIYDTRHTKRSTDVR